MKGPLVLPIEEGLDDERARIGGKAHSLAQMVALGLPVPPAFVIPTAVCDAYHGEEGAAVLAQVLAELPSGIAWIEERLDRSFGSGPQPVLVSVRSGAPISMPGMMDTILNLGIDADVEQALAVESGQPEWAAGLHARLRADLAPLREGEDSPLEPSAQLELAIRAVLDSWHSPRAITYREHHGIAERPGTAVTVQAMVFGNLDDHSGTGVAFTRNPLDGRALLYGEWLARSQGEDLVSGETTPTPLVELREKLPEAYAGLSSAATTLERGMGDMQDVEFTVQSGRLYLLQSRAGKRAPEAALRIAVELAEEEVITRAEALRRISPETATEIAARAAGPTTGTVIASGEPASPGVARGVVVADADEAAQRGRAGEAVILARATTNPTDVHGMIAAAAVITEIGGATSHAALVARDLGKPCVVGCGAGAFDGLTGETVLVDGGSGEVFDADSTAAETSNEIGAHELKLGGWARDALLAQGIDVDEEEPLGSLLAQLQDEKEEALDASQAG